MKTIGISFLLIMLALHPTAQIDFVKHDQLVVDAYRAWQNKNFRQALKSYEQSILILDDLSAADYLRAAESAACIENTSGCEEWIKRSVTRTRVDSTTVLSFSSDKIFQECVLNVLPKYQDLLDEFYMQLDHPAVFAQLQELLNKDAFSRKISNYVLGISEKDQEMAFEGFLDAQANEDSVAFKKYAAILFQKADEETEAFQRIITATVDSLNMIELIEITKEHGWQSEAWLLLWHQRGIYGENNWVWNFFKPLLDQEIKLGKVRPSFWAAFEDILSLYNREQTIYGYHPGKVDPSTVNTNRERVGLPLLTEDEIEERNNNPRGGRMY